MRTGNGKRDMELNEFTAFSGYAHDKGVIFYYGGYFSQSIIAAVADALRSRLEAREPCAVTTRRVFSSFIEMAQNILHYSVGEIDARSPPTDGLRYGAVAVGCNDDKYFVMCGNLVSDEFVPALREKLDPICRMTLAEVKETYRQQLRSRTAATGNGAGLGFLTLARDVTEPIQYALVKLTDGNDSHTFFYLRATI